MDYCRGNLKRNIFIYLSNLGNRIEKTGMSSRNLIGGLKLDNLHNNNIKLAFYKNPKSPRIFNWSDESPLREFFGVHHMKCYIFDNDVILTG